MDLINKKCVPCEGGTPPFKSEEIEKYLGQVDEAWEAIDEKRLRRRFVFKDFKEAMTFVNRVADIAEEEGHHPDISLVYNKVTLELTTHAISGLSENDFILAAKIDALL